MNDDCEYKNNGVCNWLQTGLCAEGTDCADCDNSEWLCGIGGCPSIRRRAASEKDLTSKKMAPTAEKTLAFAKTAPATKKTLAFAKTAPATKKIPAFMKTARTAKKIPAFMKTAPMTNRNLALAKTTAAAASRRASAAPATCTDSQWANDDCEYKNDGECDPPLGYCAEGTDCADCDPCSQFSAGPMGSPAVSDPCSSCTAVAGCEWCPATSKCTSTAAPARATELAMNIVRW